MYVEQKALCPKSCNRSGKGNTWTKQEYAWRLDVENGERSLRREEIPAGVASRSQRY